MPPNPPYLQPVPDDPDEMPATRSGGRPRRSPGVGTPGKLQDRRNKVTGEWEWLPPADRILTALRAGNHYSVACRFAGIRTDTCRHWKARGLEARLMLAAGEPIGLEDRRYARFLDACEEAEAAAEVRIVSEIAAQVRTKPEVGLRLLAQRHPERWQPSERREISGPDGGPVRVTHSMEDLLGRLDEIRSRRTVDEPPALDP